MRRKRPEELRSHRWFGVDDLRAFGHRSRLLQTGLGEADFRGKPVIGIINTWSDLSVCHAHFRTRAEEVKCKGLELVASLDDGCPAVHDRAVGAQHLLLQRGVLPEWRQCGPVADRARG